MPLTAQEREELAQKWQQYLASAAQQAQQAGKLGGAMARLVDAWLEPKLPWRTLLAHYFFDQARNDYNYMRPSRREGEMILPSLKSSQCDLVVAIETSGFIGEAELSELLSEINAIKGALPVRITLLACDARLAEDGPWVFEPWKEFRLPRAFQGGGGTDFAPVFAWVENENLRPDALVYFTVADAEFPEKQPPYPVIWLVKGKTPVPRGKRSQKTPVFLYTPAQKIPASSPLMRATKNREQCNPQNSVRTSPWKALDFLPPFRGGSTPPQRRQVRQVR